jgi:hypothetical protein
MYGMAVSQVVYTQIEMGDRLIVDMGRGIQLSWSHFPGVLIDVCLTLTYKKRQGALGRSQAFTEGERKRERERERETAGIR